MVLPVSAVETVISMCSMQPHSLHGQLLLCFELSVGDFGIDSSLFSNLPVSRDNCFAFSAWANAVGVLVSAKKMETAAAACKLNIFPLLHFI